MNDGYSITMSMDCKTAGLTIRSHEELTWRIFINRLRDLADQLEEEHETDEEDKIQ